MTEELQTVNQLYNKSKLIVVQYSKNMSRNVKYYLWLQCSPNKSWITLATCACAACAPSFAEQNYFCYFPEAHDNRLIHLNFCLVAFIIIETGTHFC